MNKLNHYITDMAPSYFNIGLEFDVGNSKLKLIQSDPNLPNYNLEEKCCNTGPKVAFPLAGHKQDMYITFHVHFTFPPSMTYHISYHMSYGG